MMPPRPGYAQHPDGTLSMIKYALAGIGAISLLVGGIGIANVMMLTVKERIREIGTCSPWGRQ